MNKIIYAVQIGGKGPLQALMAIFALLSADIPDKQGSPGLVTSAKLEHVCNKYKVQLSPFLLLTGLP